MKTHALLRAFGVPPFPTAMTDGEKLIAHIESQERLVAQLEASWRQYEAAHDMRDGRTQKIVSIKVEEAEQAAYELRQLRTQLDKLRGSAPPPSPHRSGPPPLEPEFARLKEIADAEGAIITRIGNWPGTPPQELIDEGKRLRAAYWVQFEIAMRRKD